MVSIDDLDHFKDEAEHREYLNEHGYNIHSGICRLCNLYKNTLSNDDGICGDCN